jgi:hypothetical protein
MNFGIIAKEELQFMRERFGYHVSEQDGYKISYKGNGITLTAYQERRSRVIGIGFEIGGSQWSIDQVISALRPDQERIRALYADNEQEIRDRLRRMIVPLLQFGEDILRGDPSALDLLYKKMSTLREAKTAEFRYLKLREKAEDAWQTKNYHEIASLYGAIDEKWLSDAEKRRLNYAKKKLRQ